MSVPSRREALRSALATLRRSRSRGAGLFALVVLGGVVECVGVMLLVPLLAALGIRAQSGGMRAVTDLFLAGGPGPGTMASLTVTFAALVAVIAVHGFLRHQLRLSRTALVEAYKLDTRNNLFRSLTRADWEFHLGLDPSRIVDTMTVDVSVAGAAIGQSLKVVQGLTRSCLYIAVALYLSLPTTALTILIGLVWLAALRAPMRRARSSETQRSEALRSVHSATADLLEGMGAAKSQADEDRYVRQFELAAGRLSRAETEVGRSHGQERVLMTTGAAVATSVLVWAGVRFLGLEVATLLVLGYLFRRVAIQLASVERGLRGVGAAAEATSDVEELLEEATVAAEPPTWHGAPTLALNENFHLEHATCTVSGHEATTPILDVTLDIPAGRTTALMGPPGSGRNTVGQLVRGLLVPESGTASVDDHPLEGADFRGWRKGIGYVSRDAVLFEGTIRANLTDDDRRASEIQHAIRASQLDALIAGLPDGVETEVGRIAPELRDVDRLLLSLARALLRRPQLLVLDDTGSALDSADEVRIRRALGTLQGAITILIITDRPSLARDAELIHWVERGRVVESGTWEELMGAGGRFRTVAEFATMEAAGVAN